LLNLLKEILVGIVLYRAMEIDELWMWRRCRKRYVVSGSPNLFEIMRSSPHHSKIGKNSVEIRGKDRVNPAAVQHF
jgi:hypothetical protein